MPYKVGDTHETNSDYVFVSIDREGLVFRGPDGENVHEVPTPEVADEVAFEAPAKPKSKKAKKADSDSSA